MKINVLTAASALSDRELLLRLDALAGQERHASAELVAHLAALDARPALYAAQGFGSLFNYCTTVLRLSEDATCSRIAAARACRSFPAALEGLASGALTLTSLRMIGPHLTAENHECVLARASGRTRREIESLVAELAPRDDVPTSVRRLPATRTPALPNVSVMDSYGAGAAPEVGADALLVVQSADATSAISPTPAARVATDRSIVEATAPERYRVQFTIGEETHSRLRRLQDLLRREVPNGDPAVIFDRAIAALLETVEKKKIVATVRSQRPIRSGTDRRTTELPADIAAALRTPIVESRHIPNDVKRAVWRRDGGRCAFVTSTGHRCAERAFLEFHHLTSYARQGRATVANISLRCRRHNDYEAQIVFGPRRPPSAHPPPL